MHRILDLLWEDRAPATARNRVQGLVAELRRSGVALTTRPTGYAVDVAPDQVDLFRFREGVEQARVAEPEEAVELLRSALTWWRGTALADVALPSLGSVLEEERLHALEARFDLELRLGRHGVVVPELASLTTEHPVRESLHRLLMIAQYRSGRSVDALETYRRLSHRLAEEYGISGSPELRRLQESILRN